MESFTIADSAKIRTICLNKREKILAEIKKLRDLNLQCQNDIKAQNNKDNVYIRKRRFIIYKLRKPFCFFLQRDLNQIEQILKKKYPELSFDSVFLKNRNYRPPYLEEIRSLDNQIKEIDEIVSLCNHSSTGQVYLSLTDSSLIL